MILVTGATGNTGSQVVRALVEAGAPVRAFVRDPERARERLGEDVEQAVGDFDDPPSFRRALDGVADVLLSCADDPRRVGWETRAIADAAAAGVRRIVRLSTTTARPDAPVAFWAWHGELDERLRRSGVASTILRSSFSMTNLLAEAEQVVREGVICAPVGGARIAMIDPRDVGAAAAAVLTSAGHDGRTYDLTGPEAITYADAAAELSAAIGHDVRFEDVPDDVAREGILAAGLPELVAGQLLTIYGRLRAGDAEQVTNTVAALTGRPPRDFATFARDHASLLRPVEPAGAR
jgi:uncharacterized protein YbjT (DUF2867 family)